MNAFLFIYPHVFQQYPQGLAKTFGNAGFVTAQNKPYWLPKEQALKLVEETFDFTCVFAFNMQFALMKKSFIEKLKKRRQFFSFPVSGLLCNDKHDVVW